MTATTKVTDKSKKLIQQAIKDNLELKKSHDRNYTNNRHAYWLDIHPSVYSRILKGEVAKVLSDGEWIRIAIKLHTPIDGLQWKTANTKTYRFIRSQILACMEYSVGSIFCDDSSIGKTYTAEEIAIEYPNVALVDCSQHKTWSRLLRAISQAFGFPSDGRLIDVKKSLIENIYTLDKPIIILDEVADLNDSVVLELKGLWNATANLLGWYVMGANGLRVKLKKKLDWNKVGYEEWFNRLGAKVQSIIGRTTPNGLGANLMTNGEIEILKRKQIEQILQANTTATGEALYTMVNNCELNPRRARLEILKLNKSSKNK